MHQKWKVPNQACVMQFSSRRSALEVHEYDGTFKGRSAHFKMTSVIGHVLSIDFPAKYQNWDTTDPSTLFDAPTTKNESNPKVMPESCSHLCKSVPKTAWPPAWFLTTQLHFQQAHVCRHLQSEAKGCDYLVLWLDCDREGENICFEVGHCPPAQSIHFMPPCWFILQC